jgi:hypothetical protein
MLSSIFFTWRSRCSGCSAIHSDSASNASANVHAHRDDGEQRAEDLLRHDVGVERRVQQQRGLDAPARLGEHGVRQRRRVFCGSTAIAMATAAAGCLQCLGVAVSAVHHGGRHPAVRQEVAQPVEVLLVQDARHVLRLGEEPLQGRLEQLDLQGSRRRKSETKHGRRRMVQGMHDYRRKLKQTRMGANSSSTST